MCYCYKHLHVIYLYNIIISDHSSSCICFHSVISAFVLCAVWGRAFAATELCRVWPYLNSSDSSMRRFMRDILLLFRSIQLTELTAIAAFVEQWASSSLSTPYRAVVLWYLAHVVPLNVFTVHTGEETSLCAADCGPYKKNEILYLLLIEALKEESQVSDEERQDGQMNKSERST